MSKNIILLGLPCTDSQCNWQLVHGSGTGIRTPIARTKTWSPTIRRSPNNINLNKIQKFKPTIDILSNISKKVNIII